MKRLFDKYYTLERLLDTYASNRVYETDEKKKQEEEQKLFERLDKRKYLSLLMMLKNSIKSIIRVYKLKTEWEKEKDDIRENFIDCLINHCILVLCCTKTKKQPVRTKLYTLSKEIEKFTKLCTYTEETKRKAISLFLTLELCEKVIINTKECKDYQSQITVKTCPY